MRMSSVSRVMPALATTTSTGPSSASISVKAASIDAASVTSARTVSEPCGALARAGGDGDAVALRDELLGDREADAAVAAGDEDGAAVVMSGSVLWASAEWPVSA